MLCAVVFCVVDRHESRIGFTTALALPSVGCDDSFFQDFLMFGGHSLTGVAFRLTTWEWVRPATGRASPGSTVPVVDDSIIAALPFTLVYAAFF